MRCEQQRWVAQQPSTSKQCCEASMHTQLSSECTKKSMGPSILLGTLALNLCHQPQRDVQH
jgi:hypothetical protein